MEPFMGKNIVLKRTMAFGTVSLTWTHWKNLFVNITKN